MPAPLHPRLSKHATLAARLAPAGDARRADLGEDPVGDVGRQPDDHEPDRVGVHRGLPGRPARPPRPRPSLGVDRPPRIHAGVRGRLPGRLLRPARPRRPHLLGEGHRHLVRALRVPRLCLRARRPPRPGALRPLRLGVRRRDGRQLRLRDRAAGPPGRGGRQPRHVRRRPADRRAGEAGRHRRLRPGRRGEDGVSDQRAHRRSEPPRRDAVRADLHPARLVPAATAATADGPWRRSSSWSSSRL